MTGREADGFGMSMAQFVIAGTDTNFMCWPERAKTPLRCARFSWTEPAGDRRG